MSLREGALEPFSGTQLSQNGAATLLDADATTLKPPLLLAFPNLPWKESNPSDPPRPSTFLSLLKLLSLPTMLLDKYNIPLWKPTLCNDESGVFGIKNWFWRGLQTPIWKPISNPTSLFQCLPSFHQKNQKYLHQMNTKKRTVREGTAHWRVEILVREDWKVMDSWSNRKGIRIRVGPAMQRQAGKESCGGGGRNGPCGSGSSIF